MIYLARLRWDRKTFESFNGDSGDSEDLEQGWTAFYEEVLGRVPWAKLAGGKRTEKCKKDKKNLVEIMAILRAEHNFHQGLAGMLSTTLCACIL